MFCAMRLPSAIATEIASSGSSGPVSMGKLRKTRDIVNFMNFTSADNGKIRDWTAD